MPDDPNYVPPTPPPIPPVWGNFAGNWLNDLGNHDPTPGDYYITDSDFKEILENRPPTGPLDRAAAEHDRDRINAQGDPGLQIAADLKLAKEASTIFFEDVTLTLTTDDPGTKAFAHAEATFSVGVAAFGVVVAAGTAVGAAVDAVSSWVSNAWDWVTSVRRLFDDPNSPPTESPVVLDLDNDGLEMISVMDSKAYFDLDGDSLPEKLGWISGGDAILVFDANRSGSVDDRTEFAFVAWKAGARTDLEGLSHFDTNGDGELSSADAGSGFDWEQFLIWKDANGDAVSQDGELVSLREAGIISIGLDLNGNASELNGNIIHQTTTFRRTDGSEGTVGDVSFAVLRGSFAPGGSAGDVSTAKDVPQGDFPDESSKLIICNMPSSSYDLVLV
ncbi:MAG: hypothetical protein IM651_04675 [Phenylobacterium sp.]|nr:hypothetical protein [Phenylobacterium sp.]